jgi:hypothetical protein
VTYGLEGVTAENPGQALFVVNNTFVNDRSAGGTFISTGSAIGTPVTITNNIFFGGGTITNQASAVQKTNFAQQDPGLVDRAAYDYRLLPGSPCINAGSDPGTGAGFALLPSRHYIHPASAMDRPTAGAIDIGAFEFATQVDASTEAGADVSDAGSPPRDVSEAGSPPRDVSDTATPPLRDAADAADVPNADAPRPLDASDAADVSRADAPRPPDPLDAATPTDAGDAGSRPPLDAAEDGSSSTPGNTGDDGAGCGCRTTRARSGSGLALACVCLLLASRRRRARPHRQGATSA